MADKNSDTFNGITEKFKDMGDGTYARVITDTAVSTALSGCGCYATATFTPTAAAYGAGDIQDTAKALTWYYANGVVVPATAIIRVTSTNLKINATSIPSGMTTYTLGIFKVARATPLADNDAWSLPGAEVDNFMDKLSLGTPVVVGSILVIRQSGLTSDYQLVAGGMVGELITDGAHTATAIARTVKLLGVVL